MYQLVLLVSTCLWRLTSGQCDIEFRMASKEFITGLQELYRNQICLWKTTIPDCSNKNIKNTSYEELGDYCKTFFKEAFVQQKIPILRTAFARYWRKWRIPKEVEQDSMMFICLSYGTTSYLSSSVMAKYHQSLETWKRKLRNSCDIEAESVDENENEENENKQSADEGNKIVNLQKAIIKKFERVKTCQNRWSEHQEK